MGEILRVKWRSSQTTAEKHCKNSKTTNNSDERQTLFYYSAGISIPSCPQTAMERWELYVDRGKPVLHSLGNILNE